MANQQPIGRRTVLRAAGGIAIASVLAGCTSGGNAGGETGSNSGTVDDWLSGTDNYDGTIVDRTDKTSVTVDVGPSDSELTFAPPAIRISPGTTVVWKWIGGGTHNVVATDGQFTSGDPRQGGSFKYTFDQPGTVRYYCEPHKAMGMKGAVVVTNPSSGSGSNNTASGNTNKNNTTTGDIANNSSTTAKDTASNSSTTTGGNTSNGTTTA